MKRFTVLVAVVCCVSLQTYAQSVYLEDAIRFSTPGPGVGARSLGMGGAYTGVANDYTALFWNPAGLAQLQFGEFSFGLSHLKYGDKSSYYGLSQSQSNNSTTLNTLGLAVPVPVARGSLVLAFGYNRESNFTTGLSLLRPNANSIIQSYARDGSEVLDRENNLAWILFLADTLAGHVWDSPIKDRITQLEKVFEGGGINNWTAGGAMDVAKNVSVGISLSYQTGTYRYDRKYTERDNQNVYTSTGVDNPRNFSSLEIADFVESNISGISAKVGLLFNEPDRYRIGVNIKTPTAYRIKETFGTTYTSTPDFGDVVTVGPDELSNEYDLLTPWVFSAGGSIILNELLLAADIEYTDWTQMEFKDANQDILALNQQMKDIFRGTANIRLGAEYSFLQPAIRIRGGFKYNTSPYEGDPSSFDQKYVTAGFGVPLGESAMLDLAYTHGWWNTYRSSYDGARVDEKVGTNNIFATVSFRF